MKDIARSAAAAIILGVAGLGLAGGVNAAPLNDPLGLCDSPNQAGNCVYGLGHPRSSATIEFPASSPQQQAIVDYVTKVTNDYVAAEQAVRGNTAFPPSELDITATSYGSGTAPAGTQSVVLKAYQTLSGAPHPNTWYKAFSSNNASGAPVTFETLFTPGSKPLDVIMPIVNQQVSSAAGQPFTVDPVIGLDPATYQNFAVTNDAVIFFFDQDELRAASGDFEVSVPRSAIANLLSPGV